MASYHLDHFRRFVLSEGIRRAYARPERFYGAVARDDEALLEFSCRFLGCRGQVLVRQESLVVANGEYMPHRKGLRYAGDQAGSRIWSGVQRQVSGKFELPVEHWGAADSV